MSVLPNLSNETTLMTNYTNQEKVELVLLHVSGISRGRPVCYFMKNTLRSQSQLKDSSTKCCYILKILEVLLIDFVVVILTLQYKLFFWVFSVNCVFFPMDPDFWDTLYMPYWTYLKWFYVCKLAHEQIWTLEQNIRQLKRAIRDCIPLPELVLCGA